MPPSAPTSIVPVIIFIYRGIFFIFFVSFCSPGTDITCPVPDTPISIRYLGSEISPSDLPSQGSPIVSTDHFGLVGLTVLHAGPVLRDCLGRLSTLLNSDPGPKLLDVGLSHTLGLYTRVRCPDPSRHDEPLGHSQSLPFLISLTMRISKWSILSAEISVRKSLATFVQLPFAS